MTVFGNPTTEKSIGSMLAAAVGDAFGWPFEDRSRRIQTQRFPDLHARPDEFFSWTRSGSRSEPYREPINAGEYSDDTQLLLATARSLKKGREWSEYFATVELPFWLVYERGGGGATKRAAQSWVMGIPPWENAKGRDRYFEAGGNGVAMRILPHVLHAKNLDPHDIASAIVENGIATHGHPRALVGAILHGMALWFSIRQEETLEFGALIETILQEFPRWTRVHHVTEKWHNRSAHSGGNGYFKIWEDTISETVELLKIAKDALKRGPLTVGPETLEKMGAFNPKTNGSGTVTAAAALFLASRYASSPLQGLVMAATAQGADTDTLASMAGSILAAIHGFEWLGHLGNSVEDAEYLKKLGLQLGENSYDGPLSFKRISKQLNTAFANDLKKVETGQNVRLPDGRSGTMRSVQEMFSQTAKAELCKIVTEDGQTLHVKRIARGEKSSKATKVALPYESTGEIVKIGIKIYVGDIKKAKDFYVSKLGLPLDKEFANGFTVAGIISCHLTERGSQRRLPLPTDDPLQVVPCIRVNKLGSILDRLAMNGVHYTRQNGGQSYQTIRVSDPFGNTLEIFEA